LLTRLKISGFKNLVEVDLRFGPLTCIAGPNGVGKSNLFDAIGFISDLADMPFVEAARNVRGGEELRSLFTNAENGRIDLIVEMVIPAKGQDDFGQPSEASATLLEYSLGLVLEKLEEDRAVSRIRLEHESLRYIPKAEAENRFTFPHERAWRDSVVRASARRTSFIETETATARGKVIRLQSDRMQVPGKSNRGGGKATAFAADSLPRTVLSSAQNSEETRTAVLVRTEMRSWRNMQLEPTSLRQYDNFDGESSLDASGRHIPATLARLAARDTRKPPPVYTDLANTLTSLVENVSRVRVERDEARRALRFMMRDRSGLELPASSLSDGTMRFVALAILQLDPSERGLVCLEEPENGIHPQRIRSMVDLLYSIACDASFAVSDENPLRQVVFSTHSTEVVKHVDFDDAVFAVPRSYLLSGKRKQGVVFLGLSGSWRNQVLGEAVSRGDAISYLRAIPVSHSKGADRSVAWKYRGQLQLEFDEVKAVAEPSSKTKSK
jgi:predicted ATPase